MGNLGLHDGVQTRRPGATLDIVPANVELCIDSEANFAACDSAHLIPVFSPVDACGYLGYGQNEQLDTVILNIDFLSPDGTCRQIPQNNDRIILLTHVRYSGFTLAHGGSLDRARWRRVQRGEQIGVLCNSVTATEMVDDGGCNVIANNQTHLAFQLRHTTFPTPTPRGAEVLAFLGVSECLYDRWTSGLNNPVVAVRQTIPFHGCVN
jgi:hypothetical protein